MENQTQEKNINIAKYISIFLSFIPILFIYFLYKEITLTGFRDGYKTEYEILVKFVDIANIIISSFFAISLINKSMKIKTSEDILYIVKVLFIFLITFIIIRQLGDIYLIDFLKLDTGHGG